MDASPKLCECGCSEPAPVSNQTDFKRGYVKGQPRRFRAGHGSRVQQIENLVGRKFFSLTVLRLAGRNPVMWECSCSCGGIAPRVSTQSLKSGNTKSCGCLQREKAGSIKRLQPYEALYKRFKESVKRHARRYNKSPLEITITFEQFLRYTAEPRCHYCLAEISWTKHNTNGRAAYNLDRKDNTQGYTVSNVVVCCRRCNVGKGNQFTHDEWFLMTAPLRATNSGNLIELAIHIAASAHGNQTDEDGSLHLLHSLEVMVYVGQEYGFHSAKFNHYTREELMSAAVLHDVPEDTTVTLDDICREFGDKVATLVDGVTRRHGDPGCKVLNCKEHAKEFYRDFIYRSREDEGCKFIKTIDLLRNLARTHKIGIKKAKWRNKLEYKYGLAVRVLTSPEPTTWEQQSYRVVGGRCYMADPNGKEIEVTPEELRAATLARESQR